MKKDEVEKINRMKKTKDLFAFHVLPHVHMRIQCNGCVERFAIHRESTMFAHSLALYFYLYFFRSPAERQSQHKKNNVSK